jgi:hypothetical protein
VSATSPEEGDVPTIARFAVTVAVEGSLRPGTPATLRATVRANLATRAAELRIATPEIEVAQANGWRPGRVPTGVALPSRSQRTQGLAAGQQVTLVEQIVIPAPGYYRVVVSAVKKSSEPVVHDGRWVQDVTHQEVWLLIDERGGRVTDAYDPTVLGDTLVPQPGPAHRRPAAPGRSVPPGSQGAGVASPRSSSGVTTQSEGAGLRQFVYYNPDTGGYEGVPGVLVRYDVYDQQYGTITWSGSAVTNGGGYFDAPCLAYYEQASGTWSLENYDVYMVHPTGSYGESGCDTSFQQYVVGSTPHAWTYVHLNRFIPYSRGLLAQSRGRIVVQYNATLNGAYYQGGSTDRITMGPPTIGGPYGRFVVAHEYGHAVHEKALGGNAAGGRCPDPHYINGYYNLECAFSEGFANFLGAAAQNVYDVGEYYLYIVDYTNRPWYTPGADGSIQEAAVGALLYDMADGAGGDGGASEPWDGVGGGYQVASTIKQCTLRTSTGATTRIRGVDHFVYCAERTIDPNVRSNFFRTRTSQFLPTAILTNANYTNDWPTAAIRPVWRKDVYGLD